jgi:ribosomal protein S18 acetylase RimI-like enzyme
MMLCNITGDIAPIPLIIYCKLECISSPKNKLPYFVWGILSIMEPTTAKQIADLLNKQNRLVVEYTANKVLKHQNRFLYISDKNNDLVACIECKKVQWYQFEVCHLTTATSFRQQGFGTRLLRLAEQHARKNGGRIIQCTIRKDNEESERIFAREGFERVSTFFYPKSENIVGVWQKVISEKV